LSLFGSVVRQTVKTDDLLFIELDLRQEVVRDPMQVRLKLKDRKVFLRKEKRFAVVYGQLELRQPDHQTIAAEIDRGNNRYDWNYSGTKTVSYRRWRRL